jgi:galactokinase
MSDLIGVALIAAVPATVSAVLTFLNGRRAQENHIQSQAAQHEILSTTNGKMDQLLRVTGAAEHALGVAEGKAERK